MRHRVISTLLTLALLGGGAAAAAAAPRFVGVNSGSEVAVEGTPLTYWLRRGYIAPASLKAATAKPDATTRRFGPVGSCRFRLSVTARAVADADEPAVARVSRLLPATGRYLRDEGTHGNAAWRVIVGENATTTGVLVKPATGVHTPPPGKRVWLELRTVGRVGRGVTECHAGSPRGVAAIFGLMLRNGYLGGFQPR